MELRRWKFSKCLKPDLEEFLDLVKNIETNTDTENVDNEKLWKELLPQLPVSYYGFDSTKSDNSDEIIQINSSSEDLSQEEQILDDFKSQENESIVNATLFENSEVINPNLQDYIDYLLESFNNDNLLENDEIKKMDDLNLVSLKELFKILEENSSIKGILKLGKSLCEHHSSDLIIRQYCSIILVKKLSKHENLQQFLPVVQIFLETFHDVTLEEVYLQFLHYNYNCGNIYLLLLNNLKQEDKEKLVRDFVNSCNELEQFQLPLLQPLISSIEEHTIKRRLINLMSMSHDNFTTDKIFIRILIDLIKNLGKGFTDQESILYDLVNKNKTLLRNTANKALNDWINYCN